MKNAPVALLACALLINPVTTLSQGESAVPFLLISPSPETNGMGGAGSTLPTTDAIATFSNPAHLGLFSLSNNLNATMYAPRTNWLPSLGISDLTYGVSAVNAGYNFRSMLGLPFDLSAGVGYSRVSIDLGTFTTVTSNGPTTFESKEHCDSYSIGFGAHYYVHLGFGFNFKRIVSALAPVGTGGEAGSGTATVNATDFGLLVDVPIVDLVSALSGDSLSLSPNLLPFVDVSMAYVKSNVGGDVRYISAAQTDPLPRSVIAGLGVEAGLTTRVKGSTWRIGSFSLVRQAEDLLVTRYPDGTFNYKNGLGDIRLWDDIVLGKFNALTTLRRGWQLQVAEFVSIRGGSVVSPGLVYSTSGYSICAAGLLKFLIYVVPTLDTDDSWVGFAAEHIDLQFHSASYSEFAYPIDGTSFQSVTIVLKGLPF